MPRLRFSLRALLLVMFVGTLAGSHLFTSARLRQVLTENAEMRKEVGRLTIANTQKINVIAVPQYEDMLWRWRVYVPEGSGHHDVCMATHGIPDNGFPKGDRGTFALSPAAGEHVLTAAIRRGHLGDLQWNITWDKAKCSIGIPEEDARWLLAGDRGFSSSRAGADGAEAFDPGQPFVLLRIRAMEPESGGGQSVSADTPPGDGMMI